MTDEAQAILAKLPELLKQTPQLRYQIYDLLAERFVEKREFNRLLEHMDRRFEESNRRFDEAREESNRRFDEAREESNRRFDEAREESNRRFEDVYAFMQDVRKEVRVQVGGFTRRAGQGLEDAVAGTLRLALGRKDVDPAKIRMRQRIIDEEGIIGPAGRPYEYDILVQNGETWIFEVKSAPDEEDADRFADKCELVARQLGLPVARRLLVTLAYTPELDAHCRARSVELV